MLTWQKIVSLAALQLSASSPIHEDGPPQLLLKKTELPYPRVGLAGGPPASEVREGHLLEQLWRLFSEPSPSPQGAKAVRVPDNGSTPIVLWHGLGQSCCDPDGLGRVRAVLERVTRAHVLSIRIGDTAVEDIINSFFEPVNAQVESACRQIRGDPALASGYHAVGFSQGGQFLRAVAQRCPDPPMKNLVTLGSQHQGIVGLPKCDLTFSLCKLIGGFIEMGVYSSLSQASSVPAQYWHDPTNTSAYVNGSRFLADINNEGSPKNAAYRENLLKLEKFVMVKSLNDSVVVPVESQHFEFFHPDFRGIVPIRDSRIYSEDWLGLKELDRSGRLIFLEVEGDHLEFNVNWFIQEVVLAHLV